MFIHSNKNGIYFLLLLSFFLCQCAKSVNSTAPAVVSENNPMHSHGKQYIELHPSGTFDAPEPKQVALLLPLNGSLSGPGHAIHDGFMAALKENSTPPHVTVYDTSNGDINAIYAQAIASGAQCIVGPLTKSHVAVIAAIDHPVPTLLLNDTDAMIGDNTYQFGLSPIHEAKQVARQALKKGYSNALVIAPKNAWGSEVREAFSSQLNRQHGQIVDILLYDTGEDLNQKIQHFLQVSDSQAREKRIKEFLGYHIETITSRRQDFDMIFLLAYPSKARQIMPLLKYYYAGNVPIYATSSVYSGHADALLDKDLDGLIFCDIPWVFSHQMGNKNWPEQLNSYNRLYALGQDSYALAMQLNHLTVRPAPHFEENHGAVYLKTNQKVARVLEWGQFKQGLAHSLGAVA
jgi:uncharacterized protein